MGTLLHLPSRRTHTVAVRQVVGRSRKSDLRIPNRRVSAEHAILAWSGSGWVLRDLGSTNGTYVNGKRLSVGERIRIRRNTLVAFGDVEDSWRLVSDSPPLPSIINVATGERVVQDGPMLGIPSAEDPEMTVYWSKAGWIIETAGEVRPLLQDTRIAVGDAEFQIQFPEELAGTLVDTELADDDGEPLDGFRFIFASDGQGSVGMDAEGRTGRLKLRPRAHHATLLLLAKERETAIHAGLDTGQAGWVDFDETAARLAIDPKTLNVHIHRARQELARHGVCGASSIVERRATTRELRFGGVAITIVDV